MPKKKLYRPTAAKHAEIVAGMAKQQRIITEVCNKVRRERDEQEVATRVFSKGNADLSKQLSAATEKLVSEELAHTNTLTALRQTCKELSSYRVLLATMVHEAAEREVQADIPKPVHFDNEAVMMADKKPGSPDGLWMIPGECIEGAAKAKGWKVVKE